MRAQGTEPTLLTLGTSVEGRDIELYLFNSLNSDDPPPLRLEVLFIGVFHGDEPISGQLLQRFVETLETQASVGVVPVLNPDGLCRHQRMNARGVDLNRNFPTKNWSKEHDDLTYFPGDAPGSEAETQVVIELIKKYSPRKIVTVHSPYKVINYDGPAKALAEAMALENSYKIVDHIGYPTPGSFGTYAGIERQIPTITLELPEDETFSVVWADNKDALMTAITTPISTKPVQ